MHSQPLVDCVYLACHARTALDPDILVGHANPPLDEIGRAQADKLAAELAGHRPSAVLSSPLHRAIATALPIADAAGLNVHVDQRLTDRDYGPWNGRPRARAEKRFGSIDDVPGAEPAATLAARALTAFTEITAEYYGSPIILVSHDAFTRALLRQLHPGLTDIPQPSACWTRLELTDGRWLPFDIGSTP